LLRIYYIRFSRRIEILIFAGFFEIRFNIGLVRGSRGGGGGRKSKGGGGGTGKKSIGGDYV
jgi:hypothetical protein